MNWSHPALVMLAALALGVSASAADKIDLRQAQSPPRPAPAWLRTVELGETDGRLKGYTAPEGVKVEIVAEHPTVTNPVALAFDDDGNLLVLERRPATDGPTASKLTFTYKDGSKRDVSVPAKKTRDVVKLLRDSKGTGAYDQASVILEDEVPSGMLLHDGWIYLSGRGTVRRYRRSKPEGPYDVVEVVAQGFGGEGQHQVSGLTIGLDGWLYVTVGDGDHVVEGSDGNRATVWRSGAVFRCRADGSRMQVYSIGYCNPYGSVAFDTGYNLFHTDNDGRHKESQGKFDGCRLMHVAEASDFGWRLRPGAPCCVPDPRRTAVFGEMPGKLPALLKTGRGAAAGLTICNDTRFPEVFRGLLLYPDAARRNIRAYAVVPDGTTFKVVEEFEFLKGADPLFRPCQMAVGPDGALYVCDWRSGSAAPGWLGADGKGGRIYRVSWGGIADVPALPLRSLDSWSKIRQLSDEKLLEAFGGEEFTDRQKARMEAVRRGEKLRPTLLALAADVEKPVTARIEAVGALNQLWNEAVRKAFCTLLDDAEPTLRRLAADGLALNCAAADKAAHHDLLQVLGDDDLVVRRAVFLAMGRIGAEGAADALANALSFDKGKDVYLRDGLVRALERLGKPGIEQLVALANSGVEANIDRAVEVVCGLREATSVTAIPRLLRNPHMSIAQRVALVRSYLNYHTDTPVTLTPLVDYLTDNSEAREVRLAAVEVLAADRLSGGKAIAAEGLKDEKARNWVLSLLADDSINLRHAALGAVEAGRLTEAAPQLKKMVEEDNRSVEERAELARVLATLQAQEKRQ